MVIVSDVNKAFAEKGLHIELPLPATTVVKGIDIMECINYPGTVKVLLKVNYVDEHGHVVVGLFHCEGEVEHKRRAPEEVEIKQPPKASLLPARGVWAFASEDEAHTTLNRAITHLLEDKGYAPAKRDGPDLYFEQDGQGFFINVALICDDEALEKARRLVALRRQHGSAHDYGLVLPAFQDTLGVPLREQENWILRHTEYLSAHRIGVYSVDNQDPNRIYSFTIHPKSRELMKYFVNTSSQWTLVRTRYVAARKKQD